MARATGGGRQQGEDVLVSRALVVFRLTLIWTTCAVAFFAAGSQPWQRAEAMAELFAVSPVTAHWRLPVGSVHNLHSAADAIQALSAYPDVARSVRLLALQSALFATLVWAVLNGGFREAIWGHRRGDLRRIGQGPHLAPVYPESPTVRFIRLALLIAAGVTGPAWIARMRARYGVHDLDSAGTAFMAALHYPDLQREVLTDFLVAFVAVVALAPLAWFARLGVWLRTRFRVGRIRLGGVPIARDLETNHFLLGGSTGTGKTELALSMARTLCERGERAVFIDYGANFLTRLARTGDFILNPFDKRAVCWSPWLELRAESDYMMMARAIVPDGFGESRSWHGLAQQLVGAALRACVENGRNSVREFLTLLISAPDELAVFAAGTPAAVMTQKGNEKMFANTRNVLMEYLEPWRFLREPRRGERGFSIRALIEGKYDETEKHGRVSRPWLFMTFRDDQRAAMQYLSATWMELVIRSKLSLPEDPKRRIWEFIDELAACKRIQSLPDELAFVRKKGGAAVIGVQDVAQIRGIYGPEIAQTMLQNLRTKVLLGCADPDTARYFSDVIGEERVLRRKKTTTPGRDLSETRRVSTSWEPEMHRLVTYSEIMCLPVRRGYLRLPDGCVHPIKVALTRLTPTIPAFVDP
jgi:Type IV secretion-system coupling protein DNA-binding domain